MSKCRLSYDERVSLAFATTSSKNNASAPPVELVSNSCRTHVELMSNTCRSTTLRNVARASLRHVSDTCFRVMYLRHLFETCLRGTYQKYVVGKCVRDVLQACFIQMSLTDVSETCPGNMLLVHVSEACIRRMSLTNHWLRGTHSIYNIGISRMHCHP